MKKFLLVCLSVNLLAFAQEAQDQGSRVGTTQQPEQPNCSRLTVAERHFAMQLSPTNKVLFCNKFTVDQRAMAMQTVGEENEDGTVMTEDDTVMRVAQENKMVMPTPSPAPSQPSPRKSCPAK